MSEESNLPQNQKREMFVMEEVPTWHPSHAQPLHMGLACQISPVTMGPRLRQEIMVGWERGQNIHCWYIQAAEKRVREQSIYFPD